MSYQEGDDLTVTVDGETREVTVETETADGLLLVTDGDERFTVGKGEVQETRELTFDVYPGDPSTDGPWALMNTEDPQSPRGILTSIQDAVDAAISEGELETPLDEPIREAGTATYTTGRAAGEVKDVTLTLDD